MPIYDIWQWLGRRSGVSLDFMRGGLSHGIVRDSCLRDATSAVAVTLGFPLLQLRSAVSSVRFPDAIGLLFGVTGHAGVVARAYRSPLRRGDAEGRGGGDLTRKGSLRRSAESGRRKDV